MNFDGRIQLVQQIPAPAAEIWRECGTTAGMLRWQADAVEGEVTPGSALTLSWPALGAAVRLEVVEKVVGRRLVLQHGTTRVEYHVEDGALRLVHEGLGPNDDVEAFASSWRVALAVLAHAMKEHRGRVRGVQWFARSTRTTPGQAYALFTQGEGLRTWLTSAGEIGPAGAPYTLCLSDGSSIAGAVLARLHGRDLAMSWGTDSALIFRTLPSPRSSSERLVAMAWSRWTDASTRFDATRARFFEVAVERLARVLASGGSA